MDDRAIVNLYWERDESAIAATKERYGAYLFRIAFYILSEPSDSEECVNDTYFGAWNSIPPQKPQILQTYLGKLTRRIAIDRGIIAFDSVNLASQPVFHSGIIVFHRHKVAVLGRVGSPHHAVNRPADASARGPSWCSTCRGSAWISLKSSGGSFWIRNIPFTSMTCSAF